MKTSFEVKPEITSDASLVALSQAGDQDAFGQIVARYQSPVCALAYSACGNVARSEDVAQDVFIAAWRGLSTLEEPGKFKAWLYGIARHLIHNAFRRNTRNPLAGAAPLEETDAAAAIGEPDAQAISKEEETILWHALSGLPQAYREPMVLFYRQNESAREVAETLDISEEAVRQRLLRGRALLNERVARIVQSGLRKSRPGDAFAVAVVAALPLAAATTTAKGAILGVAATEGTQTAGMAAVLKGLAILGGFMALPATLGAFIGHRMGRDAKVDYAAAARFWRLYGLVMGLLFLLPFALTMGLAGHFEGDAKVEFCTVMKWWMFLAYPAAPLTVMIWDWRRRHGKNATPSMVAEETRRADAKPRRMVWLVTIGAAALLVFCLSDTHLKYTTLSSAEVKDLIVRSGPGEITRALVFQGHDRSLFRTYPTMYRQFWIDTLTQGVTNVYCAPADDASVAALVKKGIACPTYNEGRDFEILGNPGRFMPLLVAFTLGMGIFFLMPRRRPGPAVVAAK